ncbi:MAG: ATP-binding protein [Oscillospiraceae bacterium]|nr:ATP-binding protein [Oscillospiraceae bacterium]
MDKIIRKLDSKVQENLILGQQTNAHLYQKLKMDYYLILTIAAGLDMRSRDAQILNNDTILSFVRPETGKLLEFLKSQIRPNAAISKLFNIYREDRNVYFGHTTLDPIVLQQAAQLWEKNEQNLKELPSFQDDEVSELLRRMYTEKCPFYYLHSFHNEEIIMVKIGNEEPEFTRSSKNAVKNCLYNKHNANDLQEGDLFLYVGGWYIKLSPFIRYEPDKGKYQMFLDIETKKDATKGNNYIYATHFKMGDIFRRNADDDNGVYPYDPSPLPRELAPFMDCERRLLIDLNDFSQRDLMDQEYFVTGISQKIQKELDEFLYGRVAFAAVHGLGGVGKTSTIFMWINSLLKDKKRIQKVKELGEGFELRRIIFLSAKKKLYQRSADENGDQFRDLVSDISSYEDIIQYVYEKSPHSSDNRNVDFAAQERFFKERLKKTLVIIDDVESLSDEDRQKILKLKKQLDYRNVKLLLTTRVNFMESIEVEPLNVEECAVMADQIFATSDWRRSLTPDQLHAMTSGYPILIWFAKKLFNMGQLNADNIHKRLDGPDSQLAFYLYGELFQCFRDIFSRNVIRNAARYFDASDRMEISKDTLLLLSLEDVRNYQRDNEADLFRELSDLHLIILPENGQFVDFSPMRTFFEKTAIRDVPTESYQKSALGIIEHLDERNYSSLYSVIQAAAFLPDMQRIDILERITAFPAVEKHIKDLALADLFKLKNEEEKMRLYEQNKPLFQSELILTRTIVEYITSNKEVLAREDLITDLLSGCTAIITAQDLTGNIPVLFDLMEAYLEQVFKDRVDSLINSELTVKKVGLINDYATKLLPLLPDAEAAEQKGVLNRMIKDIQGWAPSAKLID